MTVMTCAKCKAPTPIAATIRIGRPVTTPPPPCSGRAGPNGPAGTVDERAQP